MYRGLLVLLAEDGAEKSLFGVSSVSPFGVTLPTRISPANLSTDHDDATLVEVATASSPTSARG